MQQERKSHVRETVKSHEQALEEIVEELRTYLWEEPFFQKYPVYITYNGLEPLAFLLYELGYRPEESTQARNQHILRQVLSSHSLDIGGGRVAASNELRGREARNTFGDVTFAFYPWRAVAMGLLKKKLQLPGRAIVIDLPQELQSSAMSPEDIATLTELYIHKGYNLVKLLSTRTSEVDFQQELARLASKLPPIQLLTCKMLVSLNPLTMEHTDPDFAEKLGVELARNGEPKYQSSKDRKRLYTAYHRLIAVAQALLKDGGWFMWNDVVYQKRGDTLLWVAGYGAELEKAGWQDLDFDAEQVGAFYFKDKWKKTTYDDGHPIKLRQVEVGNHPFDFLLGSDGSVKKIFKGTDPLEPVP